MAEKKPSSTRKKTTKKTDEQIKEELRWEIRVCKEAVRRKERSLTVTAGDVFGAIPAWIFASVVCAVVPFLLFIGLGNIEERIPHTIFIALAMGAIVMAILRAVEKKSEPKYSGRECLEVLSERLRVAQLSLSALESGTQLAEEEKKYNLNFVNEDAPRCGNCAYLGKVIDKTTTTYSDGTTTTSTSVDHYFCDKIGGQTVKPSNVCDNYFSKRVTGAFDAANAYYAKIAEKIREQDQKNANGFR